MKKCSKCGSTVIKATIKKAAIIDLASANDENPNGVIVQEGSRFAVIEMLECANKNCKASPVELVENETCPVCKRVCEQEELDAYGKCAICYAKESASELFDLPQDELIRRYLQSQAHIAAERVPANMKAAPVQNTPAPANTSPVEEAPAATTTEVTETAETTEAPSSTFVVADVEIPPAAATNKDVQELVETLQSLEQVDVEQLSSGQKGAHTRKMNKYAEELSGLVDDITGVNKEEAPEEVTEETTQEASTDAPEQAQAQETAPAPAPQANPTPAPQVNPAPAQAPAPQPQAPNTNPAPAPTPQPQTQAPAPAPTPGPMPMAPVPGIPGQGAPTPIPNAPAPQPNIPGGNNNPFN